jgi:hypothetical protein
LLGLLRERQRQSRALERLRWLGPARVRRPAGDLLGSSDTGVEVLALQQQLAHRVDLAQRLTWRRALRDELVIGRVS